MGAIFALLIDGKAIASYAFVAAGFKLTCSHIHQTGSARTLQR
jgi:hypothetical protein